MAPHLNRSITYRLERWFARWRPLPDPPVFPLVSYLAEGSEAEWVQAAMTTFARSVASFVPGHYEAYARVYNPFGGHGNEDDAVSWGDLLAPDDRYLRDGILAAELADHGPGGAQVETGRLHRSLVDPLLEHLERETTTPERCFFALWEGFGDCPVPEGLDPTVHLPGREYHLFVGSVAGARTNLSVIDRGWQSANLWWPADRAWFVATEVDHAWTYVGAARSCIDAILADPRLEAVETTASARW
jgi:hypothetical protein